MCYLDYTKEWGNIQRIIKEFKNIKDNYIISLLN